MKAYFLLLHVIQYFYNKRFAVESICISEDDQQIESLTYQCWSKRIEEIITYCKSKRINLSLMYFLSTNSRSRLINIILIHLDKTIASGISILTPNDNKYPQLLKYIFSPPYVIYCKGSIDYLNYPKCVSIVGSRKAYFEALEMSYSLGARYAEKEYVIISGGAYGCDIMAHQGVLSLNKSNCLAMIVFAGALDNLYPKGHSKYFFEMLEKGACLISEKPLGCKVYPADFVYRNRIISGLSYLTFILDAGMSSGALTTAQSALEQGRELVVFKPTYSKISEGVEKMIFDGSPFFHTIEELEGKYL
jgi:DNA processing protein